MLKHYAHVMDDVRLSAIGKLLTLNYTAPPGAEINMSGSGSVW